MPMFVEKGHAWIERSLTPWEMKELQEEIERAHRWGHDPATQALIGFYQKACLWYGGLPFEERETVEPTSFAIPVEQWKQICQWLIDCEKPGGPVYGLRWMNSGPSSYEEVTVGTIADGRITEKAQVTFAKRGIA